ncbi:MAG: hypothetical protein QGH51_00665 [Planctomycetota bacterium]|jgi:hypothetical protein|nr:hypothetical protein [Planctomycetota bacterium]
MTPILLLLLQSPTLSALASTTNDTRLPQDPVVQDTAWLLNRQGQTPTTRVYLPDSSLALLGGDLDADGFRDTVEGVDALLWSPTSISPGVDVSDFLFSTVRSYGPFEDGDLLRWSPTQGFQVEYSEASLVAAINPSNGVFDLDAATEVGGELFFSLRDDLQGTVLGNLEDGDILAFNSATSAVRVVYSEGQVQAMVNNATNQSTAITDVLSLSQLPGTQSLCFSVQSPTSLDATVFTEEGGGEIVPDFSESDWDFQISSELDALAFVPGGLVQPPILSTDLPTAKPGTTMRLKLRHATPGVIAVGARASALQCTFELGAGIGFLLLDKTDYWLRRQVFHGKYYPVQLDGSGSGTFDWTVPALAPGIPWTDMYFQVLDLSSGYWSNPIALRVE